MIIKANYLNSRRLKYLLKMRIKYTILIVIATSLAGCNLGKEPIYHLAMGDNISEIQSRLNAGADINEKNSDGETALHYAIKYGNINTINYLLENGADVNFKDELNPLYFLPQRAFTEEGEQEIIDLLFNNGGPEIFANKPLIRSCLRSNSVNFLKYIIKLHPDIVNKSIYRNQGLFPIHDAKSVEMAKLLIESGADINQISISSGETHSAIISGFTPLHYAASRGRSELIEYLIEEGCKINVKDRNGRTPLDVCEDLIEFQINTEFFWDKSTEGQQHARIWHLERLNSCYILRDNGAMRGVDLN